MSLQASNYRPETAISEIADFIADPVKPAEFPQTILRFRNDKAAATVGLDGLSDEAWIAHFGRFGPLPAAQPEPLALRYHGHQFRAYNPDLGDGRGFLFAQMRESEAAGARLLDLGTKGSGLTPWSRTADGRLTLKGGVREILATEMLEALGVTTSRTFSLIEKSTGRWVGRAGPWQPEGWPEREVGWMLHRSAWGQGYASEAARACVDFAFGTLGWKTVGHMIHPDNLASQAVAARIGSRFVRMVDLPPPMDAAGPTQMWGQDAP